MNRQLKKINFGCGLDTAIGWLNYDASPTLFFQKLPLIGRIIKKFCKTKFPEDVLYGNILNGFGIKESTIDIIYCSHVLEHLSYGECKLALDQIFRLLKSNGSFIGVMPDLEYEISAYLNNKNIEFELHTRLYIQKPGWYYPLKLYNRSLKRY